MQLPSRADQTLLPALLAVMLALLLLFQLTDDQSEQLPPAGIGRVVAPLPAKATFDAAPADPVLLADPVFSERRVGKPASGAQEGPLGGAVIVGTAHGRGFARAILRAPSGAVVSVPVGGRYLGWRLLGLAPDAVAFRRGAEMVRMPLGGAYGQPGYGARNNVAIER